MSAHRVEPARLTHVTLEQPIRYPDTGSRRFMTKRARWLLLLGCVLPGSVQMLAGSRRLGRFALGTTLSLLLAAMCTLAGLRWAKETTLTLASSPIALLTLQGVLIGYATLWIVLGIDTFRLMNIIRVSPRWRLPVALCSVLLTAIPVLGAGWAVQTVGSARELMSAVFGGGAAAVEPVNGRYNILLLGTDVGEDRAGMRPDSISLVSIDAETGQSVIIGLPRELIEMPFPESSPLHAIYPEGFCVPPNSYEPVDTGQDCFTTGYLNALYTEIEASFSPSYEGLYVDALSRGSSPGIEATKDAVSGATGLTVQFYVLIDMNGFAELIDALGGVTVDVQERIPVGGREDEYGDWVDIAWYIEPGTQTLNGDNAQWYARSRHGSARGDYDRMDRQRELQQAILEQMSPANVFVHFQQVVAAGTHLVQTDIPESMLGRFVALAEKAKRFTPVTVQLTPPQIDPEYPDYAQIHELVAGGVTEASPPREDE